MNNGYTYTWTAPASAPNSLSSTSGKSVTATPPKGIHTYKVVTADERGCTDENEIQINVIESPTIIASPKDTTIKIGTSLTLNATGGINYFWEPLTYIDFPEVSNPTVKPLKPIKYYVRGTNDNGCFGYDSVMVNIDYTGNTFLPNAFTPNNDGLNDYFGLENIQYEKLHNFQIFDRFGTLVFQTQDANKKWDGNYENGKAATAGVYYYQIQIGLLNGEIITYKGAITLIR